MDKEIEQLISNSVAESIWIVERTEDDDWRLIGFKQAFDSPGIIPREWNGKKLSEIFDEAKSGEIKSNYKKCLELNAPISYEESFLHNGDTFWFLTTIKPIQNENVQPRIFGMSRNITARKATEEKLEKNEALLRTLINHLPAIVYIKDAEGRYQLINKSAEEFWGGTQEQVIGRTVFDFFPRDIAEVLHKQDLEAIREKRIVEAEHTFNREDGRHIHWSLKVPVIDAKGEAYAVCGIATNITERKKAEEKLEKSESLLRAIITNLPLAIFVKDAEGRYQLANKKAEEFYGRSQEQVIGKTVFDILPRNEAELLREQELEVLQGQQIKEYDNSFVRDGELRTWHSVKVPLINANGESYAMCGIALEVTGQRRILEALRESESRFRTMADNAPVMIWVAGPDGRTSYYNKGWLDFTGRTLEEELDNGWGKNIHPDDYERCISAFNDAIATRASYEMQYRFRRHDGVYRTLLEKGTPRWTTDGKFAGSIGSCIDITDYLNIEHRLRQSQKMDAIGRLAGGVAHDFNNLLMVILSYTDMLLNRHPGQEDQEHKHLEQVKKAAERAASLTRQLLAFSRQQPLQTQKINFNIVITDLEKMMRRIVREDIELTINLDPTIGLVNSPMGQLEQVVINLVVNACDAMPKGGSLSIETRSVYLNEERAALRGGDLRPGQYVILSISDTGTGMDEETVSRIFEPFFTTKELGKGTGLGLAIVHSVIKQNGGHVEVYSEAGHGTVFKIYLPQIQEIEYRVESKQQLEQPEGGCETVLLVEDEDMIRDLLNRVLLASGYKVLVAENGTRALQLAQETNETIHLLLTDMIMPGGINGYQLAQKLIELRPGIKTLCMSGYTDRFVLNQNPLEKGFQLMQKPFSPDELVHKVREVLSSI